MVELAPENRRSFEFLILAATSSWTASTDFALPEGQADKDFPPEAK
jgi:hypothetical protein